MRSLLLWGLLAAPLMAQDAGKTVVRGRIIDDLDSAGISGALVSLPNLDIRVRTDGHGRYRIAGVAPGNHELRIRALGYDSLNVALDVPGDSVREFRMVRTPRMLSQMDVVGRSLRVPRGFEEIYRRAARGAGTFITREQIDSLNPLDLKTVLQSVKGLYVTSRALFFQQCVGREFGQLWIDGHRMTKFRTGPSWDPSDMHAHLVGVRPADVQAIEIYPTRLQIPGEFLDGQPCGVVAIWTRRGP